MHFDRLAWRFPKPLTTHETTEIMNAANVRSLIWLFSIRSEKKTICFVVGRSRSRFLPRCGWVGTSLKEKSTKLRMSVVPIVKFTWTVLMRVYSCCSFNVLLLFSPNDESEEKYFLLIVDVTWKVLRTIYSYLDKVQKSKAWHGHVEVVLEIQPLG